MTKVFIGGSRAVSQLGEVVKARLDTIMEKEFSVLLGDANGADKAAQVYLHDKAYSHVEIFCAAGVCRNNLALQEFEWMAKRETWGGDGGMEALASRLTTFTALR